MRKSTILNQIMQLFSHSSFRNIVNRRSADKYSKKLDSLQQLKILLYSQIMGADSLRDIETRLEVHRNKWIDIGLESVARSTFADANAKRPYEVFADLFYTFSDKCQKLAPKHDFKIKNAVFSLDSTLIPLCLESFPWAKYRKRKGGLKVHMLIDHNGSLPSFMVMSDGKCSDIRAAKNREFDIADLPPDSILTIDRGYMDYRWLFELNNKGISFIIRAKSNTLYDYAGQHKECSTSQGIIEDQIVYLGGFDAEDDYPKELRLIRLRGEDGKEIEVLTNNFKLAASTIGKLYKGRWEIETFFRWIKQNLRIKTFIGTSINAVMTQIWVAMILYLLLSFVKFSTRYKKGLLELLRCIRSTLLDSVSILEILRVNYEDLQRMRKTPQQLAFY